MVSRTLAFLATANVAFGHFLLNWPPSAGFDEDQEPTSPCGGATIDFSNSSTQVQVDQFAVQIQSTHPAGTWVFRGTLDTQEPYNWTDIVPVVNTTGIGEFCLNYMSVPSEWAGQTGILQVVDDSVDGTLYQCAVVNFVSGSNTTAGSSCTNSTGFSASWSSTSDFLDNSTTSATTTAASSTGTASSTASDAAASSTATGGASAVTGLGAIVGGVGLAVVALAL